MCSNHVKALCGGGSVSAVSFKSSPRREPEWRWWALSLRAMPKLPALSLSHWCGSSASFIAKSIRVRPFQVFSLYFKFFCQCWLSLLCQYWYVSICNVLVTPQVSVAATASSLLELNICGIIVLRWSRSPMVTAGRNHSDIIFIFISHMVTRLLSTLV